MSQPQRKPYPELQGLTFSDETHRKLAKIWARAIKKLAAEEAEKKRIEEGGIAGGEGEKLYDPGAIRKN